MRGRRGLVPKAQVVRLVRVLRALAVRPDPVRKGQRVRRVPAPKVAVHPVRVLKARVPKVPVPAATTVAAVVVAAVARVVRARLRGKS